MGPSERSCGRGERVTTMLGAHRKNVDVPHAPGAGVRGSAHGFHGGPCPQPRGQRRGHGGAAGRERWGGAAGGAKGRLNFLSAGVVVWSCFCGGDCLQGMGGAGEDSYRDTLHREGPLFTSWRENLAAVAGILETHYPESCNRFVCPG